MQAALHQIPAPAKLDILETVLLAFLNAYHHVTHLLLALNQICANAGQVLWEMGLIRATGASLTVQALLGAAAMQMHSASAQGLAFAAIHLWEMVLLVVQAVPIPAVLCQVVAVIRMPSVWV